jgi:hypothetical protein
MYRTGDITFNSTYFVRSKGMVSRIQSSYLTSHELIIFIPHIPLRAYGSWWIEVVCRHCELSSRGLFWSSVCGTFLHWLKITKRESYYDSLRKWSSNVFIGILYWIMSNIFTMNQHFSPAVREYLHYCLIGIINACRQQTIRHQFWRFSCFAVTFYCCSEICTYNIIKRGFSAYKA